MSHVLNTIFNLPVWLNICVVFEIDLASLRCAAAERDGGQGGQGAGQRRWKHNLCCVSGPRREEDTSECDQV